jgi:hypothetical protein
MLLRDKLTRIQADYTFKKETAELFTVRNLHAEGSDPLRFTAEAERVLPDVKRGSTVYFRFFANDEADDFTLELYNANGEMVDALYTSDLATVWQFALLMAINDVTRPGGLVE